MSDTRMIQPHAERALAGWLIACRSLRRHRHVAIAGAYALDAHEQQLFNSTLRAVDQWLGERCAGEVALADDDSDVRRFLPRLAGELTDIVKARLHNASSPVQIAMNDVVACVLADLEEFCRQDYCPLRELDSWARTATEVCYRNLRPDVTDRLVDIRSRIGFSACPTDSATMPAPAGAIPPWLVSGATKFPRAGPAMEVSLTFGGPDWQWSWGPAPYVLMHEILNHGAQGPWSKDCIAPAETDPFAEGWMDLVVRMLHDRAAQGLLDGVPGLPDGRDHVPEAQALFAARRGYREWSNKRRFGVEVAQELRNYLRRRDAENLDETFIRLSLSINCSSAAADERMRFITGVKLALTEARKPGLTVEASLDTWIAEYESTHNVEDLLARAAGLSRDLAAPNRQLIG